MARRADAAESGVPMAAVGRVGRVLPGRDPRIVECGRAGRVSETGRLHWADMAKALSIVLVVLGHAVVGVDHDRPLPAQLDPLVMEPLGWFRMPLFFFVSGLFAAIGIRRSRAEFLDRTLFHLIYIFVVWNVIQFAARYAAGGVANHSVGLSELLLFPIQPINVTWFLWALIAFYALARPGCAGSPRRP